MFMALGFLEGGYGPVYNIALLAPSLAFLLFMASQARKSVYKLTRTRSPIIAAYYSLLWVVSIVNLLWCFLQIWQGTSKQATSWNWLCLATSFATVLLEISVVVFLLQGNNVSGWDALTHTLIGSTMVAALDAIIKFSMSMPEPSPNILFWRVLLANCILANVICIFGFSWPLFIDGDDSGDLRKWGFWMVYKLSFSVLYASVLCLPHTKWLNRLPARPAFHNYISAMFFLNVASALGCALLASGVGIGYWIYGFTNLCYHAFYPPFLYSTFLADFFQEDDLHLEDVYYSEMKDAGYFDADWD